MPSPADPLLASLARTGLLDPQQATGIREWADAANADAPAVMRELTTRRWITDFQAREIARGKMDDLVVGPHVLLDILGEGGMGRVYHARHTRLGRDEALKVIRKDKLTNPTVLARFQQEILAAAQMNHPNVVMSFDAESEGDNFCLSMEYVEGTDLTKLVRQNGAMPMPHACDAIRQAALGLQHAFERGLVHRDIKPSNLLYTPRGQVKLLDLGLALLNQQAVPGGDNAVRVTQQGFVLGTPDFLAPEQAQNPTGVDIRADIYGLGATLYYLLTARVPYDGPTPTDKLLAHITAPPPNLLTHRPDAPPQLAGLIQWMMAKKPEDRPQTPAQVAAALVPFGLPQTAVHAPLPRPELPATLLVPDADPMPSEMGRAAFADIDADDDSREEPAPRRKTRERDDRNDDDDDRPRKRRGETRVKAPKKRSAIPLLLIGLGALVVVCGGAAAAVIAFVLPALEDGKPLDPEITTQSGIKLLKMEPGSFEMGSDEEEVGHQPHEGPQRTVTLSRPFYIGVTEVTRKQYMDVMKQAPDITPARMGGPMLDAMPAVVSYANAQMFIKKLNLAEAKKRSGWEYRLPTEAEWEYCARCGGKGPFGTRSRLTQYDDGIFKLEEKDDPYGDTCPRMDGKVYNFGDKPSPVADQYKDAPRKPNDWKLYDMAGNVWEMCRDKYDNYAAGAATDPLGPNGDGQRVARGGAYNGTAADCRAAARKNIPDPNKPLANVGFRVVFAKKIEEGK